MSGPDRRNTDLRIDTSKPHPARMYDWFLGGKDNYPVDQELGRRITAMEPNLPVMARMNRAFMRRATLWLAREGGVRQFLDIGTGIPTEPNLHQVAQQVAPGARVVYCDHDPIVLAHSEDLLHGTAQGAVEFVHADARDTGLILEQAAKVLDFDKPVALSLIALLHFISDEDGGSALVGRLKEALAPGSYLAMTHFTTEFYTQDDVDQANSMYRNRGLSFATRDREEFGRFFEGFEILEPGVVLAERWHPELGEPVPGQTDDIISSSYAAVARKP